MRPAQDQLLDGVELGRGGLVAAVGPMDVAAEQVQRHARGVPPQGGLERGCFAAGFCVGALKYQQLEFDDDRVVTHGDTAVVTARVQVKGRYEKEELDGTFRHTRVWAKLPEGWRVVAFHASRVDIDEATD
jgi:hypothetical protein